MPAPASRRGLTVRSLREERKELQQPLHDPEEVPLFEGRSERRSALRGCGAVDPAFNLCAALCCRPSCSAAAREAAFAGEEDSQVLLHIYDIVDSGVLRAANQLLHGFGTGAFHVGVEVYGWEWSFGDSPEGTGVFYCMPRSCGKRTYRESVWVGTTALTAMEVDSVIRKMEKEWPGNAYDLFRNNCVHFSEILCKRLVKQGQVPEYISTLSGAGALLQDRVEAAQRLFGFRRDADSLSRERLVHRRIEASRRALSSDRLCFNVTRDFADSKVVSL